MRHWEAGVTETPEGLGAPLIVFPVVTDEVEGPVIMKLSKSRRSCRKRVKSNSCLDYTVISCAYIYALKYLQFMSSCKVSLQ